MRNRSREKTRTGTQQLEAHLYRVEQAAAALTLHPKYLYQKIADGTISVTRIGKRVMIHRDEVERIARQGLRKIAAGSTDHKEKARDFGSEVARARRPV
jgi:excisionase family DNA binding protein